MAKKKKPQELKEEHKCHLQPGDEVECSFKGCIGRQFIIKSAHHTDICSSRWYVVAYLKGSPEREIAGSHIDGVNYGIDSGWFKKNIK